MHKNVDFGIDGYNLPRLDFPQKYGTQNKFPKEKIKNFATIQANYTKDVPGPGMYKTAFKWGCESKKLQHITKKNTFLDQIFAHGGEKPGPAAVNIIWY